ncbi:DUF6894 family protein [Methylorubrum extorquens]|uniref:DUF6894 domain-containing protein n=1 Tax=Methylorubrum extorquens TaxID=408 RepID=A0AAX3WGB1_METEX|nr:hypothetical protein [Methylorubrum extorquens]WHQ70515.1 hypothetical protein KEC54_02435 [Methylorubrum extorquens]
MARHFLHIRDGDHLTEGPDGSELPDLEAALQEALEGACAILSAKVLKAEVLDGQSFEIADESGVVLAILPLKAALRLI